MGNNCVRNTQHQLMFYTKGCCGYYTRNNNEGGTFYTTSYRRQYSSLSLYEASKFTEDLWEPMKINNIDLMTFGG